MLLPIIKYKTQILQALETHQNIILVGDTGTGKTTQIPQFLLEADAGPLCVSQPRRVAAISVAERVAKENKCRLGGVIGYSVRFAEKRSKQTKLLFATDGMIVRLALLDPLLLNFRTIILDEAHERSIQTDLLLGIVRNAQKLRSRRKNKLRIIIMSATIDIRRFIQYFHSEEPTILNKRSRFVNLNRVISAKKTAAIQVTGRLHNVQVFYSKSEIPDYVENAVSLALKLHIYLGSSGGDILVFLTGREEIEASCNLLKTGYDKILATLKVRQGLLLTNTINFDLNDFSQFELEKCRKKKILKLDAIPCYAALPQTDQQKVFQTSEDTRRIIFATNIAETSITIPNISFVIDSGLAKNKSFIPSRNLSTLNVEWVSKQQTWQRSGRAGRLKKGYCFRLYTETRYHSFAEKSIPEIKRVDVSELTLQLFAIKKTNKLNTAFSRTALAKTIFEYFDLIEKPEPHLVSAAYTYLLKVNAINRTSAANEQYAITSKGMLMSKLPLNPKLSNFLLNASNMSCLEESLILCSFLSLDMALFSKSQYAKYFADESGDHWSMINIFRAFIENNCSKTWCNQYTLKYSVLIKAVKIKKQLFNLVKGFDILPSTCKDNIESLLRCVTYSFPNQIAQAEVEANLNQKGLRHTLGKKTPRVRFNFMQEGKEVEANIHPSSGLFGRLTSLTTNKLPVVLFSESVSTNKVYLRCVSTIEESWLMDYTDEFVREPFSTRNKLFVENQAKRKKLSENAEKEKINEYNQMIMCDS